MKRAIQFLQELTPIIPMEIPLDLGLGLIEKILENFYLFYRSMYRNPTHKRGTLKPESLESIRIGNEYDLQRMVYSLLLPLFPTARILSLKSSVPVTV